MSAKKKAALKSPKEVEAEMDGFLAKFEPEMETRIRAVRAALRKRFPTAVELVWDNYNFFVIGYSPTERPSDSLFAIAADRNGVGLAFYRGADLPDPHGMLLGEGKQNRFVRLTEGAKTLKNPHLVELMSAAAQITKPMPAEKGYTVVRSVSAKQRPRR